MLKRYVFSNLELIDFKTRRVAAFRKNLVELAELELKHAKVTFPFTLLASYFNDVVFPGFSYLALFPPSREIYNYCRAVWGF